MDILFDFDKNVVFDQHNNKITNDMYADYKDCPYDLLCEVDWIRFYDEEQKQKYIELCKQNNITAYGLDEADGLSFIFDYGLDEFRPLYGKVSELYDELNRLREIELLLNPDYKENSF